MRPNNNPFSGGQRFARPPLEGKASPALADRLRPRDAADYRCVFDTAPPGGPPARLVLIRGLPGSGKSTLARELTQTGYLHFEADMYFERGGSYHYDPAQVQDAHAWCQAAVRSALAAGENVVVSNTFTRLAEMAPYLSLSTEVQVLEALGSWPNVHGVPKDRLQAMANRWEAFCPNQPLGPVRPFQRPAPRRSLASQPHLQQRGRR